MWAGCTVAKRGFLMKVVILAGGIGSRLSEETQLRPKPMVEIGGRPILWHIMMIYSSFGFNDFIICLGYRGYYIKEYFANYALHGSDVTVDLASGNIEYVQNVKLPPWRVSLIDTGSDTQTGGRLKRIKHLLPPNEPFCMTYGDGVADVNIQKLLDFHKAHGLDATVTTVRPPGRFGATLIEGNRVAKFLEKPPGDGGYINGGFFVLHPRVLDRIEGDASLWELGPLEGLAADRQLGAFKHDGFWQPMDTLREKNLLEQLWTDGKAAWKMWV
jgi:glucose-1-phosphate cytidylyltransferase